MLILQFRLENTTEEENEIIPDFCYYLCDNIFETINTKIFRKKIDIRLKYLYKVNWINWSGTSFLDVQSIMDKIYESLTYEPKRNKLFHIKIDTNVLIPNSYTSIDRLIRFLDYGDNNQKGTGFLTNLEQKYTAHKLQALWQIFCTSRLGYMPMSNIITVNNKR